MDLDFKATLDTILETQLSYLTMIGDMEAQLHALQIVFISVQAESIRLHVAQELVQTFDEQRSIRRAATEQMLQSLALLRATVSTSKVQ